MWKVDETFNLRSGLSVEEKLRMQFAGLHRLKESVKS